MYDEHFEPLLPTPPLFPEAVSNQCIGGAGQRGGCGSGSRCSLPATMAEDEPEELTDLESQPFDLWADEAESVHTLNARNVEPLPPSSPMNWAEISRENARH